MDEILNKLADDLREDFDDLEDKAKASLFVLICGCYQDGRKEALVALKKWCHDEDIPGFLMEDLIEGGTNLAIAFEAIWKRMKHGDNQPVIVMHATLRSTGCSAEIVKIATDHEKADCSRIFKAPDAEEWMPDEYEMLDVIDVADDENFLKKSKIFIKRMIMRKKHYLQSLEDEKNDKQ